MPLIETDAYENRAYWLAIGVLVVCVILSVAIARAAESGAVFAVCIILSVVASAICYFSASRPRKIQLHQMVISAQLPGEPPVTVGVAIQMPARFYGKGIDDRISMECGRALTKHFERVSREIVDNPESETDRATQEAAKRLGKPMLSDDEMRRIKLDGAYRSITMNVIDDLFRPTMAYYAKLEGIPYLKFDCNGVKLPEPPKKSPALGSPYGGIVIGRTDAHG